MQSQILCKFLKFKNPFFKIGYNFPKGVNHNKQIKVISNFQAKFSKILAKRESFCASVLKNMFNLK